MIAMRPGFGPVRAVVCALAMAALTGCGGDVVRTGDPITVSNPDQQTPQTSILQSLWSRSITRVVIEVDYGPGAAPYVGTIPSLGNVWGIFSANARRLFQGSGKQLTIPTTLGEMQRIETSTTDFTLDDLVSLSRRNRNALPTASTATFHVMILNGYFRDASGQRRTDLLGGNLDGTGIIVIFKPVVQSTEATGGQYAPAIVEQTTLVHEFGHAVGLVGDGLSPVHDHEDHAHAHHCTSSSCVMNAWNEGGSAAVAFASRLATTGNAVMFDSDCLADTDAAIAAAR